MTMIQPLIREKAATVTSSQRVGQSTCAACGKTALPGSAVVLHFGKAGRVHKACHIEGGRKNV